MNAKAEDQQNTSDKGKWILVFVLLVLAVASNWYMGSRAAETLPLQGGALLATRIFTVVLLIVLAFLVAWKTNKGQMTLSFAKESRLEIRKVVWPTRQEAVQTTLVVVAITCVMGFFMFVVDGGLLWLVGLITGAKG